MPGAALKPVAMVVMTEANIKNRIKQGKIFFIEKVFPSLYFAFFERIIARVNVIGIIAKVLVNFTVTALSSVAEPN